MLLCQYKLHMKLTTSLYFIIQQCQMHYFFGFFYVFYCNLKEKDHIGIINSKKKKYLYEKSILILF